MHVFWEVFFVLLLIIANGLFAMAELAIVRARKNRLKAMANKGDKGAAEAIKTAAHPSDFLSAVQIGITLIGIFTGAFSGATLAAYLAAFFKNIPLLIRVADMLALFLVVTLVTYLSLIIGELVPKKIAIQRPEYIAALVARPMAVFVFFFKPFVKLLSFSSHAVFQLLGLKEKEETPITEEEFKLVLDDGAQAGVMEEAERDMINNILESNDLRISSLMLPRNMVVWLDSEDTAEENLKIAAHNDFSAFPLAAGDLDNIVGVVHSQDIVRELTEKSSVDFAAISRKAAFIPENLSVFKALDIFNRENTGIALVVDEFGGMAGLVKTRDIIRFLTGELANTPRDGDPQIVEYGSNSWLLDGMLRISEFKDLLDIEALPDEEKFRFNTLAGFIIAYFGHIPKIGEGKDWNGYRLEVVDMDRMRVDRVLLSKLEEDD